MSKQDFTIHYNWAADHPRSSQTLESRFSPHGRGGGAWHKEVWGCIGNVCHF